MDRWTPNTQHSEAHFTFHATIWRSKGNKLLEMINRSTPTFKNVQGDCSPNPPRIDAPGHRPVANTRARAEKWILADTDRPARHDDLQHAQPPIALYTKPVAECDQQATVDGTWPRPPSSSNVFNNSPTTIACLSHRDVPWQNFPSPELRTKFQEEAPLFGRYPNFP